MTTIIARLETDESTARQLAAALEETLDPETSVCAVFAGSDGSWTAEITFRDPPDQTAFRALVARALGEERAGGLRFETIAARDWVAASLAGLPPVPAGRFTVHGAHDRLRVPANAIGIEIEAALAFGTGHHGTTRGCLLALHALAKKRKPRRILDLGTGSGVLAIAAARTFRRPVLASDIDARAVAAARANAGANRAQGIEFLHAAGTGRLQIRRRAPFDLIFANILLEPIRRMATALARLAAPGAFVVLSGLLPDQAAGAMSAYRAQGLRVERRILLDGWVTLVLRRPESNRRGRKRPRRQVR